MQSNNYFEKIDFIKNSRFFSDFYKEFRDDVQQSLSYTYRDNQQVLEDCRALFAKILDRIIQIERLQNDFEEYSKEANRSNSVILNRGKFLIKKKVFPDIFNSQFEYVRLLGNIANHSEKHSETEYTKEKVSTVFDSLIDILTFAVNTYENQNIKYDNPQIQQLAISYPDRFKKRRVRIVQNITSSNYHDNNLQKLANPIMADFLNRAVLLINPLSKESLNYLYQLGLSDYDIANMSPLRGFGTIDTSRKDTVKTVSFYENGFVKENCWLDILRMNGQPLDGWKGVPGFYMLRDKNHQPVTPALHVVTNGLLVPYYNVDGYLTNFQLVKSTSTFVPKIIKDPTLNLIDTHIEIKVSSNDYMYEAKLYDPFNKYGKVVSRGKVTFKPQYFSLNNAGFYKEKVVFQVKKRYQKLWLDSSDQYMGADTQNYNHIQIAYNPKIAAFEPQSYGLTKYKNEMKNVWLTIGGLRAIILAHELPYAFDAHALDMYGRDVIALQTLQNHRGLISVLKEINACSITIAFGNDFMENYQKRKSFFELLELLESNKFDIKIALWNKKIANTIEKAIVNNNCSIKFYDII